GPEFRAAARRAGPQRLVRDRGGNRPRRRRGVACTARGRGPCGRRRVGLGQVGHRDDADGAHALAERALRRIGEAARPRPRDRQRRPAAQGPRRGDRDDLPGPDDVAEPGAPRRAPDRRADPGAPRRARRRGARPGRRAARAGRDPARPRALRLLPARVLRWHAPTRDDRDGAVLRSRRAHRRRADDGARRHDPGADPRGPQGAAHAHERRHHPRHARPRRRRRHRRPDRGHVRRADRRAGLDGRDLLQPAASVHVGPAGLDHARRPAAPDAAAVDPGDAAVAHHATAGLPLPAALPARARRVPGQARADRAGRRGERPHRPLRGDARAQGRAARDRRPDRPRRRRRDRM
ncbi:MAG: Oligopeptide transport ATP-binding protein OppD, partial [uncultured Solirubrobacteraceae bacterium]